MMGVSSVIAKCLGVAIMFTPIVLIVCGTLLVILIVRRRREPGGPEDIAETRMIQEMYHEMSNMAKRIDALETILLDKVRGEDKENGHGLK